MSPASGQNPTREPPPPGGGFGGLLLLSSILCTDSWRTTERKQARIKRNCILVAQAVLRAQLLYFFKLLLCSGSCACVVGVVSTCLSILRLQKVLLINGTNCEEGGLHFSRTMACKQCKASHFPQHPNASMCLEANSMRMFSYFFIKIATAAAKLPSSRQQARETKHVEYQLLSTPFHTLRRITSSGAHRRLARCGARAVLSGVPSGAPNATRASGCSRRSTSSDGLLGCGDNETRPQPRQPLLSQGVGKRRAAPEAEARVVAGHAAAARIQGHQQGLSWCTAQRGLQQRGRPALSRRAARTPAAGVGGGELASSAAGGSPPRHNKLTRRTALVGKPSSFLMARWMRGTSSPILSK